MPGLKELESAVLIVDLPDHGLQAGDVGTVVLVHGEGEGYEVEFCTLSGETVDVVTVDASQVRPVADNDLTHARKLAG